ncbi:amidase [Sphingomonas aracearum]|uniref:Amidase n=1 Tax=Sphingomonas aracearum TaxID=2283317 RepID=A0A369VXL8_9SPHN|nr:amidase [Sphingomonas aracearum]RDE07126.1 amidase [Sphingomonas aracearum]
MRRLALSLLITVAALSQPVAAQNRIEAPVPSAADLQAQMAAGTITSVAATRAALARIAAMDRQGPTLRAVIAVNPDALAQAAAADARRKAGRSLGPLDGVPVLVKDNIETADPLPTTAGSLALAANVTRRDAPVIARLRAAGAVILAKANLSEWANIRSDKAMSGWSAVAGLVRNPYALDRSACGSSSGSGVGVAAGYAPLAIGTETDGSVVCPSAMNGLVGLKPTMGLVSRTHVVPISHSQDTPGPMATNVRDTALLFSAMVGSDPADAETAGADRYRRDYAANLSPAALKGVRVAVLRPEMPAALAERFDAALAVLKRAGAVLVPVEAPSLPNLGALETAVLQTELKADLAAYLATTPAAVKVRTLADVIAFNKAHAEAEMPFFAQETFEAAEARPPLTDAAYLDARAASRQIARAALDGMLEKAKAVTLVTPTYGMPWLSDPVYGDQFQGPSASELPAVSGYPHLTVPMGLARGLPVGLSFIGRPFADGDLLRAGFAFEQAAHARVAPRFLPSADVGPGLGGGR